MSCCQWRSRITGFCSSATACSDVSMFLTVLSTPVYYSQAPSLFQFNSSNAFFNCLSISSMQLPFNERKLPFKRFLSHFVVPLHRKVKVVDIVAEFAFLLINRSCTLWNVLLLTLLQVAHLQKKRTVKNMYVGPWGEIFCERMR